MNSIRFKNKLHRRTQMRNARMRYWRRQCEKFIPAGLTTRGTQRIYTLHPEINGRGKSESWKRNMRAKIYRRMKSVPKIIPPMEAAYRRLRSEIKIGLSSIDDIGWARYEMERENHELKNKI